MITDRGISQRRESQTPPIYPSNSAEYINTLSHYYRGELARMVSWRDRLDRTTNWAVGGTAAMLSISFSSPKAHHGGVLFAMLLVFLLLCIESRRYRFFHVFRSRVRLLESNYYAGVFAPYSQTDPAPWMNQLSQDLRSPSFSITFSQAMARRLRRNYGWIFLILLLAWLFKTTMSVAEAQVETVTYVHSIHEFLNNAAIGYVPGPITILIIIALYGWILYVMLKHRKAQGELGHRKALV